MMYMTNAEAKKLKKVKELERAALNCSPDEISEIYKKLGYVEFTARALGLACRFRGVDCVRALVKGGASFDTPTLKRDEQLFHAYSRKKRDFNHSDYSVYLLNIRKKISGSCCCKGMKFAKSVRLGSKGTLQMLPDSERAEVLKYLCANRKKISFKPWELLLYAIFVRDDFVFKELKKLGIKISDYRVKVIVEGGAAVNSCLREYCSMAEGLSDNDYIPVMERLHGEVGGKFHCTEKIFEAVRVRFYDPKIVEFFVEKFETDKLNKLKILRGATDENNTSMLALGEKLGWLANTKRRDTLIEYSANNGKTECTAWLLDFKNRTADLAAERAKAERKLERELNAAPDSVTALRALWSYGKLEDGTLIIKRYKGARTDITVPEKIGKSVVTAIGDYAFSPSYPKLDEERKKFLETIEKVTFPDTVTKIGKRVFDGCEKLCFVNLPSGISEIADMLFARCGELEEITIPDSVKRIGKGAFGGCVKLRSVCLPCGICEIGDFMFERCSELEEIALPDSVKKIGGAAFTHCENLERIVLPDEISEIPHDIFFGCTKLKETAIPNSVRRIGERAFYGCDELREVIVPDGVVAMGSEVFSHCSKLETVVLPASIKQIENYEFFLPNRVVTSNMLTDSPNAVAVVVPDSYAEGYCKQNNIPYKYKE